MTQSAAIPATNVDPEGEFPFDVATYLFHLFAVIAHHRDAALDQAMRPLGLSLARHRALAVIARTAPCTMSQLADFTAVDRTTMTRTVDQLVAAGLVERATPSRDRRKVLLTLTRAGRDAYRQSLKVIFRSNRQALAGVPVEMQRIAARTKEMILANLVDDGALTQRLLFRDGGGEGA